MEHLINNIQNWLREYNQPTKIGLTQFKTENKKINKRPSIKNKDVKLSDLIRGKS